eukprot:GEMP01009455.1.p1 GENE.GEMP01009455.1~~GEMP01009455.1.p1  ORF type:complete len:869 (+),score=202.11 GEMP01009455.1:16-2622(+)
MVWDHDQDNYIRDGCLHSSKERKGYRRMDASWTRPLRLIPAKTYDRTHEGAPWIVDPLPSDLRCMSRIEPPDAWAHNYVDSVACICRRRFEEPVKLVRVDENWSGSSDAKVWLERGTHEQLGKGPHEQRKHSVAADMNLTRKRAVTCAEIEEMVLRGRFPHNYPRLPEKRSAILEAPASSTQRANPSLVRRAHQDPQQQASRQQEHSNARRWQEESRQCNMKQWYPVQQQPQFRKCQKGGHPKPPEGAQKRVMFNGRQLPPTEVYTYPRDESPKRWNDDHEWGTKWKSDRDWDNNWSGDRDWGAKDWRNYGYDYDKSRYSGTAYEGKYGTTVNQHDTKCKYDNNTPDNRQSDTRWPQTSQDDQCRPSHTSYPPKQDALGTVPHSNGQELDERQRGESDSSATDCEADRGASASENVTQSQQRPADVGKTTEDFPPFMHAYQSKRHMLWRQFLEKKAADIDEVAVIAEFAALMGEKARNDEEALGVDISNYVSNHRRCERDLADYGLGHCDDDTQRHRHIPDLGADGSLASDKKLNRYGKGVPEQNISRSGDDRRTNLQPLATFCHAVVGFVRRYCEKQDEKWSKGEDCIGILKPELIDRTKIRNMAWSDDDSQPTVEYNENGGMKKRIPKAERARVKAKRTIKAICEKNGPLMMQRVNNDPEKRQQRADYRAINCGLSLAAMKSEWGNDPSVRHINMELHIRELFGELSVGPKLERPKLQNFFRFLEGQVADVLVWECSKTETRVATLTHFIKHVGVEVPIQHLDDLRERTHATPAHLLAPAPVMCPPPGFDSPKSFSLTPPMEGSMGLMPSVDDDDDAPHMVESTSLVPSVDDDDTTTDDSAEFVNCIVREMELFLNSSDTVFEIGK